MSPRDPVDEVWDNPEFGIMIGSTMVRRTGERWASVPRSNIETAEDVSRFMAWREYLCAIDYGGNGGDTPPLIEFWRNNKLVVQITCAEINRDHMLDIALKGRRLFRADTLVLCFDAHHTFHTVNPATGQPWKSQPLGQAGPGEMQLMCDNENACQTGVLTDCLMAMRLTSEHAPMEQATIPYHVHKSSRTVHWTGFENWHEATEQTTRKHGKDPKWQSHFIRERESYQLTGRVDAVMRAAMRPGDGELAADELAELFEVTPEEAAIHADMAAVRALAMMAPPCIIQLNPVGDLEVEIFERSIERISQDGVLGSPTQMMEMIVSLQPDERERFHQLLVSRANGNAEVLSRIEDLFAAAEGYAAAEAAAE